MSAGHEAKRAKGEGDEDPAVSRFRSFLRINTLHPTPDYRTCVRACECAPSASSNQQHCRNARLILLVTAGAACVFLKQQADEIGLLYREVERELLSFLVLHTTLIFIINNTTAVSGKPIAVLTWEGKEPSLPSLMLNSHTDVVPVFPVRTYASSNSLTHSLTIIANRRSGPTRRLLRSRTRRGISMHVARRT